MLLAQSSKRIFPGTSLLPSPPATLPTDLHSGFFIFAEIFWNNQVSSVLSCFCRAVAKCMRCRAFYSFRLSVYLEIRPQEDTRVCSLPPDDMVSGFYLAGLLLRQVCSFLGPGCSESSLNVILNVNEWSWKINSRHVIVD